MVRLTRAGEYAIRGMLHLARHRDETLAMVPDIAEAEDVSVTFLAKIFQGLAKSGLVESTRGAAGGVSLGRPAEEITLRDIIEAVEGPMALNRCLLHDDRCERAGHCVLAPVWRSAQDALLAVLEGVTLAQFNGTETAEE